MRMYAGADDLDRLCDFLLRVDRPPIHPGDFQWRLSAPDLQPAENLALWEDRGGQLVGFAFVQVPWRMLDYATSEPELAPAIVAWATRRIEQITTARGQRRTWYAGAGADDAVGLAVLAEHGFVRPAGTVTHLRRRLDQPDPAPPLPAGFTLRALAGPADLPAYVTAYRAAFPLSAMSVAWREQTLQMPGYGPDLDVVVQAPDGMLVAFCLGWLPPGGAGPGELEPLGVHPAYQRLGLGRAAFVEVFRRLYAHDCRAAIGQTTAHNTTALQLYTGLDCYPLYQVRQYFREFVPAPGPAVS